MKVAVNSAGLGGQLASLNRIARTLEEVVAQRHELVRFPDEYRSAPQERRRALADEVLAASDVVLGPSDGAVIAARERTGSGVPMAHLLLGCMPRGAFNYLSIARQLRSTDVLVANSEADAGIARAFYPEARVEQLPFSYDDTAFGPVTEQEAARARAEFGIPAEVPLVIYAGRSTLEKNVHTVIRVFSLVLQEVPDAHLVLAGPIEDHRFPEFGVFPLVMMRILHRVGTGLGIMNRVHMLHSVDAAGLRALYGASDVALNLTLHHDENFGLAQVEAAACGTPVVGTRWGGLKDTVVEGVTGLGVSTWTTAHGVKVSWWEAANHVVRLLRDRELRDRLGSSAREHALRHYSTAAHAEAVDAVIRAAAEGIGKPWQALEPSAFAKEFWDTCAPRAEDRSSYMRGPRSMELYRAMIEPYAGTSAAGLPLDAPLEGEQVLSLATPLQRGDDGTVEINDPVFPLQAVVPDEHRDAVRAALDLLEEEPAIRAELLLAGLSAYADAGGAVRWMMDAGLVVRSAGGFGDLDPRGIGRKASLPVITIRPVDHPADVVVVR
jgi:glycosyltransferase involved in cell wall biosynthesis